MNELLSLNEKLMHAPAGVVVALFSIALGYILKASDFFPNNRIPFVIVLFTTVMFPTIQFCSDWSGGNAKAGFSIPMNLTIGFILGFAAWSFHAQILRRFVDPKLFKPDEDKPSTPEDPAQPK